MTSWDRVAPDLVVGTFEQTQVSKLRIEISALHALVIERTRSAPSLLPFSAQVCLAITADLPADGRLRAVLAQAVGVDEPEWVWQWHELDVWQWLAGYCTTALGLLPQSGGRVEIRTDEQVRALAVVADAIGVVAGYRAGTDPNPELRDYLTRFQTWCEWMINALAYAATDPVPLPQLG